MRIKLFLTLLFVTFPCMMWGISASPNSLYITYQHGSDIPTPRNISITGANRFTAEVSANPAGWFTVSPLSGTVPAVLLVRFSPEQLPAGEYQGLITVRDPDTTFFATVTVWVTLKVTGTQNPPPATSGFKYFPQLADGGGWKTSIVLVNNSNQPRSVELKFWSDDARSLAISLETWGSRNSFSQVVNGLGTLILESTGVQSNTTQGWVSVSDPQGSFGGVLVYTRRFAGRPDYEAAVPLGAAQTSWAFPYDETRGFETAIALANTGNRSDVRFRAFDTAGSVVHQATLSLATGEHLAFQLKSRFPALANTVGSIEITGLQSPITAVALRFNPTGPVTVMPAVYAGSN